jgi:peroxiredoxin
MFMVKNIKLLVIILILFGLFTAPALGVQKGKEYGNLSFPPVGSGADQSYLGLSSAGAFKLKQIGAPYVVVEIMRDSCPHCQEQAPGMNKFYHLVQGSDLKGKVKFLGVAQGCSANEVKQFKKRHKVPFPMLADPNGSLKQALHIEGVPTTVLLNQSGQALQVHVGNIGSPKKALAELQQLVK